MVGSFFLGGCMQENAQTILEFWFGDLLGGGPVTAEYGKHWFGKNEKVDAEIARTFGPLLDEAVNPGFDWSQSADGALAQVVLLDQFSRNIYRGQPRSFAFDPLALQLAQEALMRGYDKQVPVVPRAFFYLPFEHCEELVMQERSVDLFKALLAGAPEDQRGTCEGYLDYAERHRVIIQRFGRFPHRNAILGRESTAEEVEFLKQPGSGF